MANFLAHMSTFKLKMDNVPVQATIVLNENECVKSIAGLRQCANTLPLVGIDLKQSYAKDIIYPPQNILFLYVESSCVIFPIGDRYPVSLFNSLATFLSDTCICFVGKNASENAKSLNSMIEQKSLLASSIDVNVFAARILKNPELKKCTSLVQLGKSIGLDFEEFKKEGNNKTKEPQPDWKDLCLSEEDLKNETSEAYMSFKIADFCRKKIAANKEK